MSRNERTPIDMSSSFRRPESGTMTGAQQQVGWQRRPPARDRQPVITGCPDRCTYRLRKRIASRDGAAPRSHVVCLRSPAKPEPTGGV